MPAVPRLVSTGSPPPPGPIDGTTPGLAGPFGILRVRGVSVPEFTNGSATSDWTWPRVVGAQKGCLAAIRNGGCLCSPPASRFRVFALLYDYFPFVFRTTALARVKSSNGPCIWPIHHKVHAVAAAVTMVTIGSICSRAESVEARAMPASRSRSPSHSEGKTMHAVANTVLGYLKALDATGDEWRTQRSTQRDRPQEPAQNSRSTPHTKHEPANGTARARPNACPIRRWGNRGCA